ncbi:MAG: anhydro-N-acetylmuramic acid kinase, partial [Polaromonas sp.]|nr:anhydro-N-acetylmuramic acid kinase [Polaromonas sp.]
AAIESYGSKSKELIVCGGGAFNHYLLQRLQARLPFLRVSTSDLHGLPPLRVEATAFAWLARQMLARQPGNLPGVTGAAGLRVLGALYPA